MFLSWSSFLISINSDRLLSSSIFLFSFLLTSVLKSQIYSLILVTQLVINSFFFFYCANSSDILATYRFNCLINSVFSYLNLRISVFDLSYLSNIFLDFNSFSLSQSAIFSRLQCSSYNFFFKLSISFYFPSTLLLSTFNLFSNSANFDLSASTQGSWPVTELFLISSKRFFSSFKLLIKVFFSLSYFYSLCPFSCNSLIYFTYSWLCWRSVSNIYLLFYSFFFRIATQPYNLLIYYWLFFKAFAFRGALETPDYIWLTLANIQVSMAIICFSCCSTYFIVSFISLKSSSKVNFWSADQLLASYYLFCASTYLDLFLMNSIRSYLLFWLISSMVSIFYLNRSNIFLQVFISSGLRIETSIFFFYGSLCFQFLSTSVIVFIAFFSLFSIDILLFVMLFAICYIYSIHQKWYVIQIDLPFSQIVYCLSLSGQPSRVFQPPAASSKIPQYQLDPINDQIRLFLIRIYQRSLFISIQLSWLSMTTFSQNDINVILDSQKEVVIFDADNIFIHSDSYQDHFDPQWDIRTEHNHQEKDNHRYKYVEGKEKQNTQKTNNMEKKIIEGLDDQIMRTNQNLFKVVKNGEKNLKKKIEKGKQTLQKIEEKKSNSILIQGYLNKKTDGLILKWSRRYFVLTPQKLLFFSDQSKGKAIGCVNIKIAVLEILFRKAEIILDFQGESENIILKSDTKEETELWKDYLQKVVQFQSKEKKIFLRTIHKPLYAESNTIPEREFYKEAETGDILLFYTKHIGAKLQRIVTNSDFDHVGMVVKFRNWEVMVFECNQSSGVSLFEWNQYVRHFNLYEKITYRKLVSPRKTELQHALLKFVKMNIGKKYQLSLSKLLTFQSDFNWDIVKQDNERGYFCSELIAKSYKSIGILDPSKSSCRYWPVDFSQKSQLQLKKGCYLDLEQQILLNKHVKKIV